MKWLERCLFITAFVMPCFLFAQQEKKNDFDNNFFVGTNFSSLRIEKPFPLGGFQLGYKYRFLQNDLYFNYSFLTIFKLSNQTKIGIDFWKSKIGLNMGIDFSMMRYGIVYPDWIPEFEFGKFYSMAPLVELEYNHTFTDGEIIFYANYVFNNYIFSYDTFDVAQFSEQLLYLNLGIKAKIPNKNQR